MRPRWLCAIYDFNGTLINDAELAYESVVHIFRKIRPDIEPPTLDDYRKEITSDFTKFYYKHGIPESVSGAEMNAIRVPFYEARRINVRLNDGAVDLLHFCFDTGIPNAIVSASPEDVRAILRDFGVGWLFNRIRVGACNKSEALVETLDYFGVKAEDAFYLDDTFDGLSAARELGMGTVGFTGGYNSESRIRAACPDEVVGSLADVISLLRACACR